MAASAHWNSVIQDWNLMLSDVTWYVPWDDVASAVDLSWSAAVGRAQT
jgi:hypothetical protein